MEIALPDKYRILDIALYAAAQAPGQVGMAPCSAGMLAAEPSILEMMESIALVCHVSAANRLTWIRGPQMSCREELATMQFSTEAIPDVHLAAPFCLYAQFIFPTLTALKGLAPGAEARVLLPLSCRVRARAPGMLAAMKARGFVVDGRVEGDHLLLTRGSAPLDDELEATLTAPLDEMRIALTDVEIPATAIITAMSSD